MQWPVFHTTHGPRLSSQVCRTGLMTVERVIDFSIFDPGALPLSQSSPKWEMTYHPTRYALPKFFIFWLRGANPWAKVHQKGRWPGGLRDLPPCKISLLYANPRPRYLLPKFLRTSKQTNRQTEKQTVNDISPACLSACGDNKWLNFTSKEWICYSTSNFNANVPYLKCLTTASFISSLCSASTFTAVITSSDPIQLNSTWPVHWPMCIKWHGHLADQLSWIGSGDVITLKTQLNSTWQKSRQFSVSREVLNMFSTSRLTASWRLFCQVFWVTTSSDPTQLNSVGQLSDHSKRWQSSWVGLGRAMRSWLNTSLHNSCIFSQNYSYLFFLSVSYSDTNAKCTQMNLSYRYLLIVQYCT